MAGEAKNRWGGRFAEIMEFCSLHATGCKPQAAAWRLRPAACSLYKEKIPLFQKLDNRSTYSIQVKIIHSLIPVFLFISILCAQDKADFLIASSPLAYTILNQYEQPLSGDEKKVFLPFMPLQIIREDDVLGDGVTDALKFRLRKSTYFLIKDEEGSLIGSDRQKFSEVLKGCSIINDTVEVIKDRTILVSERYPGRGSRAYLKKGDILVRFFKHRDRFCLMRTGTKAGYVWSALEQESALRTVQRRAKKQDYTITGEMQEGIKQILESANSAYHQYFNFFNGLTGKQKSVPHWNSEYDGTVLRCFLGGTVSNGKLLEASTQHIIRDVENILIGKPFSVIYKKGAIMIEPDIIK
jgi:hypothetical protein